MDCGLLEILRLLVYCAIWWKVYLWGLDIVIVLWKLSVVPVLLNIVCGVLWCTVYLWIYCLFCLSMAPKKRSKNDARSSSSRQAFDGNLFANARAFERYQNLSTKPVIQDRGMECNEELYRHDPNYDEIRRTIVTMGWKQFVNVPDETNTSLMLEFLANWP